MTKSHEQIIGAIAAFSRAWLARPAIRILDAFEGIARVTVTTR